MDQIVGPILAALKHDHKKLDTNLAERGLDKTHKDSSQRTALDFLNENPISKFDALCQPLFKLLNSA